MTKTFIRQTVVIPANSGSEIPRLERRKQGLLQTSEFLAESSRDKIGNGQVATKEQHVEMLLAKGDSTDTPWKYVKCDWLAVATRICHEKKWECHWLSVMAGICHEAMIWQGKRTVISVDKGV